MTDNNKRDTSDRRKLVAVIGGAVLLIAGSFGANAVAESRMVQHAKLYVADAVSTPGAITAHWGGKRGRHGGWSRLSDAELEKRIERMAKHVAIEIDATDEQTQKITALVTALAKDMRPLRGEFRDAGKKMRDLLTASTIDRAALETLRAERMAVVEARSKDVVNALADVAEVLTAEQRETLSQRIEEFRGMRRGHRFWRHG